jgi:hypothetical protein
LIHASQTKPPREDLDDFGLENPTYRAIIVVVSNASLLESVARDQAFRDLGKRIAERNQKGCLVEMQIIEPSKVLEGKVTGETAVAACENTVPANRTIRCPKRTGSSPGPTSCTWWKALGS